MHVITNYADKAALEAASPPAIDDIVTIAGRSWRRTSIEPSHDLKIQDTANDWWEIGENIVTADDGLMMGTTLTDAQYTQQAAQAAFALGRPYLHNADHETFMKFDVETEKFLTPEDKNAYNASVNAASQTSGGPANQAAFDDIYHDDIKRFNGLKKVMDWYQSCPQTSRPFHLNISNGLHRIFGKNLMSGFKSHLSLLGRNSSKYRASSITFVASTRPGDFTKATLVLNESVNTTLVKVGMGFHFRDAKSTVASEYDLTKLNGAHIINEILTTTVDNDTLVFDVWDKDGGILNNPTAIANTEDAKGVLDIQEGEIFIPGAQFAITGGFNDRSDEALLTNTRGASVREERIGWVDHMDTSIQKYGVPGDPDTKMRYAGYISKYDATNCVYVGGQGRTFRSAKIGLALFNRCGFGGVGKNDIAERGVGCQLMSQIDLTRCSIGSYTGEGIVSGGRSSVSAQNCIIANCATGIRPLTGGSIDISASWVVTCDKGFVTNTGGLLVATSQTVIENFESSNELGSNGQLLGATPPTYISVDPDLENLKLGDSDVLLEGTPATTSRFEIPIPESDYQDVVIDVRDIASSVNLKDMFLEIEVDDSFVTTGYHWRYTDFPTDSASSIAQRMDDAIIAESMAQILHNVGSGADDRAGVKLTVENYAETRNLVVIHHTGFAVDSGKRARYVRGFVYLELPTAGKVTGIRLSNRTPGTNALVSFKAGLTYSVRGKNIKSHI